MWQVESEVNDATAGRSQVSSVKKHTHEETLHDGRRGVREQEEEEDDGIAVVQHFSSLCELKQKTFRLLLTVY